MAGRRAEVDLWMHPDRDSRSGLACWCHENKVRRHGLSEFGEGFKTKQNKYFDQQTVRPTRPPSAATGGRAYDNAFIGPLYLHDTSTNLQVLTRERKPRA